MSVKEEIYKVLDARRGESVSGEELAQKLGVTRNAVWKAVRARRREGFGIAATPNRGYALLPENDVLTASGIYKYLKGDFTVSVKKTVASTNDEVKAMAESGMPEWTAVFAEEQTAGRGRYSRPFYSPQGAGLYVSILLRPQFSAQETLFITTSAAVAVCEAIESAGGRDCLIKWVNDVFIGGKKVCGILTEASFGVESGKLSYAVVGIGVNVRPTAFPAELNGIAGSVFEEGGMPADARAKLAAAILERFRYYYENIPRRAFFAEYKRRSFVIGRQVTVNAGEQSGVATVLDLNDDCSLRVRFADGREGNLSAGEVSIRAKNQ